MLDVDAVGRFSGSKWLVEDATLEVRAGDRIGIVGPSGSGKTILLRLMALLDAPQTGHIRWCGARVEREAVPSFRREVVYVHQRPALIADATVLANLRVPFRLRANRKLSFDPARILRWLDVVGRSQDFVDRPARVLSGGEAHLVSLLRAVQLNPKLLLLDEPTAALDPDTARSVERLLVEWLDEENSRALVWVGHDHAQVDRMSRRILTMKGGRLVNR